MSSSANTAEITCPRCKGDERVVAQSSHGKGHKLGQCYRKIDLGISGLWPDVKDYGQKTDLAGNKVQQSYFLLHGLDELVAPGKESHFNKKLITKWMLENAMQRALKSDGEWIADIKQLPRSGTAVAGPSGTNLSTNAPTTATLRASHSVSSTSTLAAVNVADRTRGSGAASSSQAPPSRIAAAKSHPDDWRPFEGVRDINELPAAQPPSVTEDSAKPLSAGQTQTFDMIDQRQAFHKGPSQPSGKYLPRDGFADDHSGLEVATNHFRIDFRPSAVLYEYQILGLPESATRPKKRVLVDLAIRTANVLNAQEASFATDHQQKIVAWKDLSMWNGQTVPACEKEIVAEFSVLNYGKDGNPKGLPLRLQFLRKIHLSELTSFVHGRQSCLNDRTEMLEALNLVLMKTAVSGQSSPAFQTGKYKMFSKLGYDTLTKNDQKLVFRSYTTSPKLGMGHVLLNMSTGATMFHKSMTIAKYLAAAGQFQGAKAQAKDDLRGVTVYVNFDRFSAARGDTDHGIDDPPRRIKIICGFADELAGGCTFTDSGGVTRSVYQHMQYMYSGTTKCAASSVLVNVGGKSHGKQRYYAAEDLTILPYQSYKRKLDSFLTSAMIKKAERHPHDNITAVVTEGLKLLGIEANRAPPSALATAGIRVAPKMLSVPAYVVASPTIRYRCNESIEVANGSWTVVPETHRLLRTQDGFCGQPFLIHVADKKSQLDHATRSEVFKQLPSLLATSGLDGMRDFDLDKNFASVKGFDCSVKTFTGAIRGARKNGADLVVLLLPKNDAENQRRYANFKIAADQYEGITSMCLNEQKISSSMNISGLTATGPFGNYARNVGMKLNMRLGGTNHCITSKVLDLKKLRTSKGEPDTIILGADVTHQSGGSAEHTPSIAAVVGSVDPDFSRFLGSMSLLPKKTEIIDRSVIIKMVKERLRSWSEQNGGRSPTNIIYYRDGVGDSQYDQVLAEVDAIVPAWQKNAKDQSKKDQSQSWDKKNQKDQGKQDGSREPKITAIVVTKRHNTRLFPTTQGDQNATKTGNVLPGTIVESTITSPYYQDFYLVSHHSLKGTGRPAHYFVLRDGIGLGIANIQQLSNDICYLYGRSTTSVSYATPAYYADRLCERGRVYLKEMFDGEKAFEGKNEDETMEAAKQIFKRGDNEVGPWHKNLNETMFWM